MCALNSRNPLKKRLATFGSFDGVHIGHRYFLSSFAKLAARESLKPLVITIWPHPRLIRGEKLHLLSSLEERLELLKGIGFDEVLVLDAGEDLLKMHAKHFLSTNMIKEYGIAGLVSGFNNYLGADHRHPDQLGKLANELGLMHYTLTAFPERAVSSSLIRETIAAGNMAEAHSLLGYPYIIDGNVVGGNQIGREMGFPTANIAVADLLKQIPGIGVYAVELSTGEQSWKGMMNIGYRPTVVKNQGEKSIEVHLFNMHEDLYGKEVKIRLFKKIREEMKFESVDALIKQLRKDKKTVMHFFNL